MLMFAEFNLSSFCTEAAGLLTLVGWFLTIFKVAIPLVIVIFGILDLGTAVVAAKEDEVKNKLKRLLWRIIAGLLIFFIPTIIIWIFGAVSDYNAASDGFDTCKKAILYPWEM